MKKALQTTFLLLFSIVFSMNSTAQSVVINELMASNDTTVTDDAGEFDDWIELYNTSNSAVDMSGWYISDKSDNPGKFQLPIGLSLGINEYLIIWADEDGDQGDLHANFKLSANGEVVILSDSMLNKIDSVSFGAQVTDVAYARFPNGTGNFILQEATFASENSTTSTNRIENKVQFNIFPNPTTDFLNIEILDNNTKEIFQIFDANGQLIHTENVQNTTFQVDLTIFKSGLYLLKYGGSVKQFLVIK